MKKTTMFLAGIFSFLTAISVFASDNLLLCSDNLAAPTWKTFNKSAVVAEQPVQGPDNKLNAFKLQIPQNGFIGQLIPMARPGKTYRFTVWMKSATGAEQEVQLAGENNPPAPSAKFVPFNVTADWQKLMLIFTCPPDGNSNFRFSIRNCDVYVAAPEVVEIEENNK